MAEQERWPLWLPVFFGLGIALYFGAASEPPRWAGVAVSLIFAAGFVAGYRVVALRLAIFLALLTALGFSAAQLRSIWVEAPSLEGRWGPAPLTAEVLSVEKREKGWRFVLRPLFMEELSPSAYPERVRVTAYRVEGTPRPGDTVALRAQLRPPSPPTMPGTFDFARQAYFQQLGGIGFALGSLRATAPGTTGQPENDRGPAEHWTLFWAEARQGIAARIAAVLPGQKGAVAVALVTGQRGALAEDTREDMRGAGLAHLLAISGLHMGLVAGLLFYSLRAGLALVPGLALRRPIKKWAAVAAGLGAFVYLCLVGGAIPAQRAFLMVSIVLLAILLERRALSLRLVALAAFVVLMLSPESLVSASFQMSFAAVVALVSVYESWERRRYAAVRERGVIQDFATYVLGIGVTSLIAILATSAFAVFHFQRLALFGLLANLVAVPLTAFVIMPFAVLGMVLMPFGLEAVGFVPMGWGIDLLLLVAEGVAGWPAAHLQVPPMPLWGLASVVLGGLWLCLWQGVWRRWGALVILLGAASPATVLPPDLLVSGDGRLVAIRDAERYLWLPDRRSSRFVIDSWRRGSFAREVMTWPKAGGAANGRLLCDPLGCLYRSPEGLLAVSRDPLGATDDCAKADVLVSLEPLRRQPCRGPALVIDRFDFWRDGGHAVWLEETGPRALSVRQDQGLRPWSPFAQRQR
ncbi:ComEC/Rec2 family competence protein [Pelagibius litoralis]|uniref:ComEC/Rec2 family competence protein n=1 Tax=Pelagibius litoralis TaxID=374515 RepID=A0A967EX23_9PROT|nr:ComEC/Rec2 family competence protein [Pelagibius litoralis]NIA67310.1 ComEC/Rec2 family competence protein [Pelagibius litoralis]